jgi:cell division protein FtsB
MKEDSNKVNGAPASAQPKQQEGEVSKDKPTKTSRPSAGVGKRIMRWMLWLIVVFGLGATVMAIFFYVPLQQKLSAAEANSKASAQKLSDYEKKIENLTAQRTDLENKNKDFQSQLDQAHLRLAFINAKSDIMAANLAVSAGDSVGARLSLEKAAVDMQVLTALLKDGALSEVLATLQQHLEQVKSKVTSDANNGVITAQPDLDILLDNISKLEDAVKN